MSLWINVLSRVADQVDRLVSKKLSDFGHGASYKSHGEPIDSDSFVELYGQTLGNESREPGSIHSGHVVYVGPKFVKVEAPGLAAVVFLGELSDVFVDCAADVVVDGDEVEFVLVEPSAKKEGEWIASISAVPEARLRQSLSQLAVGDVLEGTVVRIEDRYVQMDCNGINARVPREALSWGRIRHPIDAVSLHQRCNGKVHHINLPKNWLRRKSDRNAHVILSIRDCVPFPASPFVDMFLSAQPFRLWAAVKKPADCDAVVLYVLQEVDAGRSICEISEITGLPTLSLQAIFQVLESKGLVLGEEVTARGKAISRALWLVASANAEPVLGMFVSAAPVQLRFLPASNEDLECDYPRAWPPPPYNKKEEASLSSLSDESLPLSIFLDWGLEGRRKELAALWADSAVTVFTRREGKRPWRAIRLKVPEYWILAGMWTAFEPVGKFPFCPEGMPDHARNLLLVKLNVETQPEQGGAHYIIYFEPSTNTCWKIINSGAFYERQHAQKSFPELPQVTGLGLNLPNDASVEITPVWVSIEIKI